MDLSQGFFADAAHGRHLQGHARTQRKKTAASYLEGAAYAMRYLNAARHHLDPRSLSRPRRSLPPMPSSPAEKRVTLRSEQSIQVDPKGDAKAEIAKAASLRAPLHRHALHDGQLDEGLRRRRHPIPAADRLLARTLSRSARPESRTRMASCCSIRPPSAPSSPKPTGTDFDIHVHAIGDGAMHATLDAFEALAQRPLVRNKAQASIAHVQLIDPARFFALCRARGHRQLPVLWAWPESYTLEAAAAPLGEARHPCSIRLAACMRRGAPTPGAATGRSVRPLSSPPIQQSGAAHQSRRAGGLRLRHRQCRPADRLSAQLRGPGLRGADRGGALPLEVAIDAYTIGSARDLRLDDQWVRSRSAARRSGSRSTATSSSSRDCARRDRRASASAAPISTASTSIRTRMRRRSWTKRPARTASDSA